MKIDPLPGIITVVTIAGDLVGEYEVAPGMTVSSLRDKIAHSRGSTAVSWISCVLLSYQAPYATLIFLI